MAQASLGHKLHLNNHSHPTTLTRHSHSLDSSHSLTQPLSSLGITKLVLPSLALTCSAHSLDHHTHPLFFTRSHFFTRLALTRHMNLPNLTSFQLASLVCLTSSLSLLTHPQVIRPQLPLNHSTSPPSALNLASSHSVSLAFNHSPSPQVTRPPSITQLQASIHS
ncbi:hypothetical protein ACFE04_003142 [Oxalis oulophora]